MLNLYIACCQKLYIQHCHFLYIVNLLITIRFHSNKMIKDKLRQKHHSELLFLYCSK